METMLQVFSDLDIWSESGMHRVLCLIMLACAVFTLLTTLFVVVPPYGRHETKSPAWGFKVPATVAWMIMESPALLIPLLCMGPDPAPCLSLTSNKILLALFVFHYVNRAVIFPMRMRGGKPMPLSVMVSALLYCTWNGYLQGRHLTTLSCEEADLTIDARMSQPQFYLGVLMFFAGWFTNYHSDDILRNLRKPGETGYKIPRGGLFEFVSGANFASETFEWIGFAVAANTLPAICFAVFTFCNVGPRAIAHHRWYQAKFKGEYPAKRKAFIPFVW